MSNIATLDSNHYAIQQAQANYIGKVGDDSNASPVTADTVQAFVSLAIQPGMLVSILQGQSLMANLDSRPSLSSPPVGQSKINVEHTNELMKLISMTKGGDINKLERTAASASTMFNTQPNLLQTAGNAAANKSLPLSAPATEATTHPVHSQKPVASGTDITAVDIPTRQFVNMMGDLKMLAVTTKLTESLIKQEAEFAKSSAQSSIRAVNAAERSGNKGIDAEKQRMNGAITSGSLGLIGQGVTTSRTVKALNTESKSIGNNLAGAVKLDSGLGTHNSALASSTEGMLHRAQPAGRNIVAGLESGNSTNTALSGGKRQDHNQIQIKTNQTRVTSDYSNAAINSSQKVIDGAFNVEAANENKQAELARADQAVNNELANTHQQSAKKAAESKAALIQALESSQNSHNSTASSIVDRIR